MKIDKCLLILVIGNLLGIVLKVVLVKINDGGEIRWGDVRIKRKVRN